METKRREHKENVKTRESILRLYSVHSPESNQNCIKVFGSPLHPLRFFNKTLNKQNVEGYSEEYTVK